MSAERLGREAARFAERVGDGIERMADAYQSEWSRRDGYAYHAGDPGPGPNRHRLRRDMRRGKIAGVCAGLSNYFGWRVKWVRIVWILGTVFFFPMPAIAYVVLAVVMKRSDDTRPAFDTPEEERFWRTYTVKPKATFAELRHRFRAIETRVERMEYAVTSNDWGLRKQFRDLERGA
jgi:phage shock protein C